MFLLVSYIFTISKLQVPNFTDRLQKRTSFVLPISSISCTNSRVLRELVPVNNHFVSDVRHLKLHETRNEVHPKLNFVPT